MKKTIKEDHIIKNTKDGMRQKTFRYFYWAYAIASIIGLVVAITKDNEAYVYQIPIAIIFAGLILRLVDIITKRNKKTNN
ncbi:hypothetical protein K9M74_01075 [Candidatus Woesearchaeota archaeon]|nr:hypothetical protein [Candidatus Woesearchaeota archaeon]